MPIEKICGYIMKKGFSFRSNFEFIFVQFDMNYIIIMRKKKRMEEEDDLAIKGPWWLKSEVLSFVLWFSYDDLSKTFGNGI